MSNTPKSLFLGWSGRDPLPPASSIPVHLLALQQAPPPAAVFSLTQTLNLKAESRSLGWAVASPLQPGLPRAQQGHLLPSQRHEQGAWGEVEQVALDGDHPITHIHFCFMTPNWKHTQIPPPLAPLPWFS